MKRTHLADLQLPDTPEGWLQELDDLTLLHIAGEDPSRLRIVSALLHGNEPSSLRAVHRFLTLGKPPATDVWLLVGAVSAAVGPPLFGHRFLPEHRDLNRVWLPPHESPWATRIAELLELFRASGAEALLDVHNNTGHNPPYGVGPDDGTLARQLTSLFGDLFVHTPIRLGTLMEAVAPHVPCVAVECGRAGDPEADAVALRGLEQFLGMPSLAALAGREKRVRVLGDPVRVTVQPGFRLAFDTQPVPDTDLTLDPRIDRHNFQMLAAGELLGWCPHGMPPLQALGATGDDRAGELFECRAGQLRVVQPFMPVMMTTSAHAALQDCLFYAVHPRPSLRVLFIHGKESNPHGTKGRVLAEHFVAHGEQMDTDDFAGSVRLQAAAIEAFAPDVVVGSSYGGAVLCALMDAGHWRGPSLLLAPATRLYAPDARLAPDVPVVIVHGLRDDIVPIDLSRALAGTGSPNCTVLHEVDDDHRLNATVASGRLVELVRETHDLGH